MNRCTNILPCCLILLIVLGVGCANEYSEKNLMEMPRGEDIAGMPDYADNALGATGGLEAWVDAKKLQLEAVVTLYRADGSSYLTQHHYDIYTWSNSIRVSAREPAGSFSWLMSQGEMVDFQRPDPNGSVNPLNGKVSGRDLAEAVLDVVTAAVRFVDNTASYDRHTEPVKIDTQWYYAIDRQANVEGPPLANVTFYQDLHSNIIDTIELPAEKPGDVLLVRAYNYKKAEPAGILVPTKIEIFKTDASRVSRQRLVGIDFKNLATLSEVNTYSPNPIRRWFEKLLNR